MGTPLPLYSIASTVKRPTKTWEVFPCLFHTPPPWRKIGRRYFLDDYQKENGWKSGDPKHSEEEEEEYGKGWEGPTLFGLLLHLRVPTNLRFFLPFRIIIPLTLPVGSYASHRHVYPTARHTRQRWRREKA